MTFVHSRSAQGLALDAKTPGGHPLKEVALTTLPIDGNAWQLAIEVLTPEQDGAKGRAWNAFTPVAVIDINRLLCSDQRVGYPVILRVSATVHDESPEMAGSAVPQTVAPEQDLIRT